MLKLLLLMALLSSCSSPPRKNCARLASTFFIGLGPQAYKKIVIHRYLSDPVAHAIVVWSPDGLNFFRYDSMFSTPWDVVKINMTPKSFPL